MKIGNVKNNVENNIRSILLDDGHFRCSAGSQTKSTSSTWSYFDIKNNVGPDLVSAQKGITLIALIITIIIMLILAGVVISLTLGKNGLFSTAKYAVTKTKEETAREKLELVLADLQARKYTDETYDENEYINNYLRKEGMTVEGNVVLVDGWKFTIDRSVPRIGENVEQGKLKKVTITTPYIGTTSFTTKVSYVDDEEEIETYIYKVDEEEITTLDKEYTTPEEQELQPESTHTVKVIAKYKDETTIESNIVTIKTEPRTYLYNNGDEYIDVTNGWTSQSIAGYGSDYGDYNKGNDYLYVKNTSTYSKDKSYYFPSWITQKAVDISKYKKLVAEGEFYAPTGTLLNLILTTNSNNWSTGTTYATGEFKNGELAKKLKLDFNSDIDFSKAYHIAISCVNSNYNEHTEATIKVVYLDK